LPASAQQKLPTIGWFGSGSSMAASQWVSSFSQRLRELGRIEESTVAIEYSWAEGCRGAHLAICDYIARRS
jgi:hypothetical protein